MTGVPTFVTDGLLTIDGDRASLIGTRCESCDTLYFPQSPSCRNPSCNEKRVVQASLPSQGTLLSYTFQRYRPPPLFRVDEWRPYTIGLVDFGHGLEVMGMVTGIDSKDVLIGMTVHVVAAPLFSEGGSAVLTYAFSPGTGE